MSKPVERNAAHNQIVKNKLASDIIRYLNEMLEGENTVKELLGETTLFSQEISKYDICIKGKTTRSVEDFANVYTDTVIKGVIEVIDSYIK